MEKEFSELETAVFEKATFHDKEFKTSQLLLGLNDPITMLHRNWAEIMFSLIVEVPGLDDKFLEWKKEQAANEHAAGCEEV